MKKDLIPSIAFAIFSLSSPIVLAIEKLLQIDLSYIFFISVLIGLFFGFLGFFGIEGDFKILKTLSMIGIFINTIFVFYFLYFWLWVMPRLF